MMGSFAPFAVIRWVRPTSWKRTMCGATLVDQVGREAVLGLPRAKVCSRRTGHAEFSVASEKAVVLQTRRHLLAPLAAGGQKLGTGRLVSRGTRDCNAAGKSNRFTICWMGEWWS